jgi:hypothetical protein
MYNWATKFAGLVNGTFPNITARNASGPAATDGFPFTADGINDLNLGWMQAALNACPDSLDKTPNNAAESASASQILTALRRGVALPPGIILLMAVNQAAAAKCRVLKLAGQRPLIADYPELFNAVYIGDANNADTAYTGFYRCDSAGARDTAGAHFQLPDPSGLFPRFTGAQTIQEYTPTTRVSISYTHNGGVLSGRHGDAARKIIGGLGYIVQAGACNGAFYTYSTSYLIQEQINSNTWGIIGAAFDTQRVVPIDTTNHPAFMSFDAGITY